MNWKIVIAIVVAVVLLVAGLAAFGIGLLLDAFVDDVGHRAGVVQALQRHDEELRAVPGVRSLGTHSSTDEPPHIVVYVAKLTPEVRAAFPATLDGYRVDNLAGAGAAVGAAHALGAGWSDLGLARDRLRAGLRLGLLTVIPIVAVVGIGLAIPWTREFFRDSTISGASAAEAAYTMLLRIPFGTALSEELIFRGALLGLYLQRHRPWVAVVMSSAAFGLWHVLPTLNTLGTNAGTADAAGNVLLQAGAVAFTVLATGLAGCLFCLLRLRSGSIVAPWLTHTAFNSLGYLASRLETVLGK